MKRVLIVAGDPSGDLIASKLVESMKRLEPGLTVVGLGGQHLKQHSDVFLGNIVHQHALGFAISPKQILFFHRILNQVILPELIQNPPDAVIPVDFYGFNSRVARVAKSRGHRVFYYVSPQFWASRSYRADRLRPFVDLFLCLFPFEAEFYRKHQLPAQFVGHPILDQLPEVSVGDAHPVRIEPNLGLLPGSRPDEIKRHLPVMLQACEKIAAVFPRTRFILFTVPNVSREFYYAILDKGKKSRILVELIQDEHYLWRSQLDLAITASGMETLENALLGIPMVVMYKTNWITYLIARMLIQIPYLAMPNLLSNKKLVPEFIQFNARPGALAQPIIDWLKDPALRVHVREELLALRQQMGEHGASERAARTILDLDKVA